MPGLKPSIAPLPAWEASAAGSIWTGCGNYAVFLTGWSEDRACVDATAKLDLAEGDILDFYRVEALETNRLVRFRAELKAPGLGWMEWRIHPQPAGGVALTQIAYFAPKGVPGFLYWYLLLPVHRLVFAGLIRAIGRLAGQIDTSLGPQRT